MIGEGHNKALLCLTDLYQFFNESVEDYGGVGQWYLLNGSAIALENDTDSDIYVSGGLGVVRLNHRSNTSKLMPIGKFRCDILDSNKATQSIYVNVVYNREDMSISSSPATTVKAGISGAAVGGAVAGGVLLITAGTAIVILAIWRYKVH